MTPARPFPWSAIVVAMALLLRLAGVDWGLPGPDRYWSHHPDESQVVVAAQSLDPIRGRFATGFYNYGQGYLLAGSIASRAAQGMGIAPTQPSEVPPLAPTLLWFRFVSAVAGTLAVAWLIAAGSRLYSRQVGLIAGAMLAEAPLAVQHAHFATVDTFAMAAVTGATLLASRYASGGSSAWLPLAGLASGVAAGTKYNAGLVLALVLAAWWNVRPRAPRMLLGTLASAGFGFLLSCPGAAIEFDRFREDLLFEARHMGAGSEDIFAGTWPGWIHHGFINLPWALGPVTAACVAIGVGSALRRRAPADGLIAAFVVPYWLLIGAAQVKFARYLLPVLPLLVLWAAAAFPATTRGWAARFRWFAFAGIATGFVVSIAFDLLFMGADPRDQSLRWMREHGTRRVAFARRPWYWSPAVSPGLGHFSPAGAAAAAANWQGAPQIAAPSMAEGWSQEFLVDCAADVVVVSEFEARDGLRIGSPRVTRYLDALGRSHPKRIVFESPLALGRLRFSRTSVLDGFPVSNLPHDMLYANPTIVLHTP
ncbi:MAG: ArnT family glycosyltransferase [Armatimonadota bacterium]